MDGLREKDKKDQPRPIDDPHWAEWLNQHHLDSMDFSKLTSPTNENKLEWSMKPKGTLLIPKENTKGN